MPPASPRHQGKCRPHQDYGQGDDHQGRTHGDHPGDVPADPQGVPTDDSVQDMGLDLQYGQLEESGGDTEEKRDSEER